jgi:hypothetical protein
MNILLIKGWRLPLVQELLLTFSLGLFLFSPPQTAITYQDYKEPGSFSSLLLLAVGGIAILGGGLPEWFIWLANPLYVTAIFLLLRQHKNAPQVGLSAAVLAASFLLWEEVLVSENGRNAKITALELGYWLWLSSILLMATATTLQWIGERKAAAVDGE